MPLCAVLAKAAQADKPRLLTQAEEIFFETSLTKTFRSAAAKQAFRERWFGHYAETQPEAFLFAIDGSGAVIGYVAGCFDSFSSAARAITDDIAYYTPAFRAALRDHPSHFHINVKPRRQRSGVGRQLIQLFLQLCRDTGSPGIHVVTGAASPAVKFYEGCGFERFASVANAGPHLAVLACSTASPREE